MSFTLTPHHNPRIDGLTEAGRLRWILEFTRMDLQAMPTEAVKAIGDDLRHAAAPWYSHVQESAPMPADQVQALQEEIRRGIHAVLSDSIDFLEFMRISRGDRGPKAGWALPVAARHLVPVRIGRQNQAKLLCVSQGENEWAEILDGVGGLLSKLYDQLRTCSVCGTLFVRQYRQEYCTVRCSNKVRNRRRLDRNRKTQQLKTPRRHVMAVPDMPSSTTA
jgi:hypothetical protein